MIIWKSASVCSERECVRVRERERGGGERERERERGGGGRDLPGLPWRQRTQDSSQSGDPH